MYINLVAKKEFRYKEKGEKRKMKSNKTIASLLTMTLLTLVFAQLPLTSIVHANPGTELTFLTHWTEPKETAYWDNVIKYYTTNVAPDVKITRIGVDFMTLFEEITLRHLSNTDPDMVSMHSMWIPAFANWKTQILAAPDLTIQNDIKSKWTPSTVSGSTYKGTVWGYPSEYNTWALVYNRKVFQDAIPSHSELAPILAKLEHKDAAGIPDQPLTWTEFKDAARLLTKWDTSVSPANCTQAGFSPFTEGMSEEERYQFLSLLWSDCGEYLDTGLYKAIFNNQSGYDVMQLYHDLGYEEPRAYDPAVLPGYWDIGWQYENIGMMIMPTWMTYLRDVMKREDGTSYFDHLGIAPIPYNADRTGAKSTSATYNWIIAVTKKAADEGRGTAAWAFLNWLTTPQDAGYIPKSVMGDTVGAVPKGDKCSLLGDFYTYDSIIPSRTSDQENAWTTEWDEYGNALNGTSIKDDFWLNGFKDIGTGYGRADKAVLKGEEAQAEVGLMLEKVSVTGAPVVDTVNKAASRIDALLPLGGDINFDNTVDVTDASIMMADWGATPGIPAKWNLGRSDLNDDNKIDIHDVIAIIANFGKVK